MGDKYDDNPGETIVESRQKPMVSKEKSFASGVLEIIIENRVFVLLSLFTHSRIIFSTYG